MNRRDILRAGVGLAIAGVVRPSVAESTAAETLRQRVCLFTDHLDDGGFSYQDIARNLAQLGIAGPDLTVRSGGVVAPQQVKEELPKAAAVFSEHGLRIPMISTNLNSVRDDTARPILDTMQRLGIEYFKLGYYHYDQLQDWRAHLDVAREELQELTHMAQSRGVQIGLHNHAGPTIGGALWDGIELLDAVDAATTGYYFDPAHATIEGSKLGWRLHLERIASRLKMVALKDFVWEKHDGHWNTRWCPLGEGQVDWTAFFDVLNRIGFRGPMSLHIEYDPGGRTAADRLDNALVAAQRDLSFLRQHLDRA